MNKLNKIDELLENENKLEKYINDIEQQTIETPQNLKEKINLKITKKKNKYYTDICKIAACLIFSLAVCRMDFITNDEIKNYKKEEDKPKSTISINEKISNFCKWVTTPIEKEEEEK